jgi:hypothetical protein
MTKNSKNISANQKKKNPSIRNVIVFFSLLAFVYFSFQYLWSRAARVVDPIEVSTFEDRAREELPNSDEIIDLEVGEVTEKGAEFIYQTLLKNQMQIDSLRSDIQSLRNEVSKYKSHKKIGRLILSYVNLREKFFAGEFYRGEFRSFRILSSRDKELNQLGVDLIKKLAKFQLDEKLENDFAALVPELMAIKYYGNSDDLLTKVRRNLSKLITIKRTDKNEGSDIEAVIFRVKAFLKEGRYQEALTELSSVEEKYKLVKQEFTTDLQNRIEVEKTDQEILNYLNNIS